MPNSSIKVLLCDDHHVFIEGLRLVLERAEFNIVGDARTGKDALDLVNTSEPDIVIMDVHLPDIDGLTCLASIKAAHSKAKVIILTAYLNPEYLTRAISLGASGYLSKETHAEALVNAIESVYDGESIIDHNLLKRVVSEISTITYSDDQDSNLPALTEQEIRILILIGEGLNNTSIADILSVSTNTVKSHVSNIFSKIGVTDRTQAAVWAHRNGIVP